MKQKSSTWNLDQRCSEGPRTLSMVPHGHRQPAWPKSDPYTPKTEADIRKARRKYQPGRNTPQDQTQTDIPNFLCVTGK